MRPSFVLCIYSSYFLILVFQIASALRCAELGLRHGRVRYRSRGRVAMFGCWPGYSLYGERYAGCFRGSWDVTIPKCVRRGCAEVTLQFGTVRKPLSGSTAVAAFKCFPGYDLVGPKEIYCDGQDYDKRPPECKRVETSISCDFENQNTCKWRNDMDYNLTFHLRNSATPSRVLNTGPDHDHTLDPETNGNFIYLESSSTLIGEVARISTPFLPHATDDNTCFKFWYHMYGSTIGFLRVYINETLLFEKSGNRGDRWRLGKVKLPTDQHFKISVEAVTGNGYLGDIALDDFDTGLCTEDSSSTCSDRCDEDEDQPYATCSCHSGCIFESSCCSDYHDYCVTETTTEIADSSASTAVASTVSDDSTTGIFTAEGFSNTDFQETNTESDYMTLSPNDLGDDYQLNEVTMEWEHLIDHTTKPNIIINTFKTTESNLMTTKQHEVTNDNSNITVQQVKSKEVHEVSTPTSNVSTSAGKTTERYVYTTKRYNLRPRINQTILQQTSIRANTFTSMKPTFPTTNQTTTKPTIAPTPFETTTKTTTTKPTTIPIVQTKLVKIVTPVEHVPITTGRPSTKDLKITRPTAVEVNLTSYTDQPTIDVKSNVTREIIVHVTEQTVVRLTDVTRDSVPTKWKSKYQKKGAYKRVSENKQEEGTISIAAVFSVVVCLCIVVASMTAIIIFLWKRRLNSGPCDGAEIVFIPSDEMLDFNPATNFSNRDSGVYSETVVSLKRDKAAKR